MSLLSWLSSKVTGSQLPFRGRWARQLEDAVVWRSDRDYYVTSGKLIPKGTELHQWRQGGEDWTLYVTPKGQHHLWSQPSAPDIDSGLRLGISSAASTKQSEPFDELPNRSPISNGSRKEISNRSK